MIWLLSVMTSAGGGGFYVEGVCGDYCAGGGGGSTGGYHSAHGYAI